MLARKYTVAEYGTLIAVFVFGNIVVSFFELGFANYFQRRTASDFDKAVEEFNSAFTFRVITYLLILTISFIYYYGDKSINTCLVFIIITSIFVFTTSWLLIKIFYGMNEYRTVFFRFLTSRILLLIVSVLLLFTDVSLTLFSISFFISAVSEFILLVILLKKKENFSFKMNLKTGMLKRIFISSVPMGLGIFFVMVYDRIDVLLIQKIIGIGSVGTYAVAYSFYKIPHMFVPVILTPLFTDLSAGFETDKTIDFQRVKKIGILLILLSALSMVFLFLSSDLLIDLVYGNKYHSSIPILKLLIIALPFLFLNNLTGVTLNSIRREKLAFYSLVMAAGFNFMINIFLLNFIGLKGAVISTILTELLVFLIQLYYIIKFKVTVNK